ncbi:MAG: methyltransferase domain-containing protein [Planctomycetes bacterium]|nr:methyltransferase domain-containing protein [Planctomycetota bacterium]
MVELPADHWGRLDPVYSELRRRLRADPAWRYGPLRVHEVASRVHERLSRQGSIVGLRYLDVGAGQQHPLGTTVALYLNGLSFGAAMDYAATEPRRAAEALYDLLVDCLVEPDRWHWSDIARDRFLGNVRRFDLPALRAGDLDRGIRDLPLRYLVGDLGNPPFKPESFDLMSSQAVLEHFLDHGQVFARLYQLLARGGRAYHRIDLSDHRRYDEPDRFHHWSFLAEDEAWSDGLCNRLRAEEMVAALAAAGFEVEVQERHRLPLPPGFRSRLAGRFAAMSDAEIETTAIDCLTSRAP